MTTPVPIEPATAPDDAGLLDADESQAPEIVLQGIDAHEGRHPPGTFRKILSGMATLVAACLSTYFVPALADLRPWTPDDPIVFWNVLGRGLLGSSDEAEASAELEAKAEHAQQIARAASNDSTAPIPDRPIVDPSPSGTPPARTPHPDDDEPVPHALEMPSPTALDAFFAALEQTELGHAGAITRAVHYGDSVIATDNVTSTLRETMQRRFGDAGHGFHLLAQNNASYRHRGIRFSDGEGWTRCHIIRECRPDGRYGLGATAVWSSGGARSRFATATDTGYGQKVSRFELWYLARPGGGTLRVVIDGGEPQLVDTAADVEAEAFRLFEVEDGPHAFEVRAQGGGRVQAFGVVLEREGPGVVWDEMSQVGAFASRMLNFDPHHLSGQLDHRGASLVVFQFGGNDLLLHRSQVERFQQQFREMLQRFRDVPSPPACLVVSPVDHGERRGERIVSVAMMEAITRAEREAALAEGCAFFDTRAAMGGEGSVATWRRSKPPLISGDLAHLTEAGGRALGRMIYLALMQEYRAFHDRKRGRAP